MNFYFAQLSAGNGRAADVNVLLSASDLEINSFNSAAPGEAVSAHSSVTDSYKAYFFTRYSQGNRHHTHDQHTTTEVFSADDGTASSRVTSILVLPLAGEVL